MHHMSHDAKKKTEDRGFRTSNAIKVARLFMPALVVPFALSGCTPHVYTGHVEKITNVTLPATGTELPLNAKIFFNVSGTGVCTMQIDWGDGISEQKTEDLGSAGAQGVALSHTFTGWPGMKKVKAKGLGDCSGDTFANVSLGPKLGIGFISPQPTTCQLVPNQPQLIPGWLVHITTNPNPQAKIDFGCPLSGCVYDANGEPNSLAPSTFPFPGLRKFSLVIKVGTQIVQGGTDVSFTPTQIGALELCVNDDALSNNSGFWGIFIEVSS